MGRNAYFQFKNFRINFNKDVFAVGTDACLLAAWFCQHLKKENINTCLDVGCGSGILAVFAAKVLNAKCTTIDINADAIIQCQENFSSNQLAHLLDSFTGNLNLFDTQQTKKFDLIVCNPPYFNSIKKAESNKELARHSAEHFSIESFFILCKNTMAKNASVCIVIPIEAMDIYTNIATENNLQIVHKAFVRGHHTSPIKRVLLHFKNATPCFIKHEIICLETSRGVYTDKAFKLLKPYYLYL